MGREGKGGLFNGYRCSSLQDEESFWSWIVQHWLYLTLLNYTFNMVRMVSFMCIIFLKSCITHQVGGGLSTSAHAFISEAH